MANKSSNGSNNSNYELPPFELVQILHGPVFGAGTSAAAAGPSVVGVAGSPSAPGGGALSPPAAGSAATAAAASPLSPPTLSGRLSQLVIKHQQRSPAAAGTTASPSPAGGAGLSSAAEIAVPTPEVSTLSLSPDGRAASSSSRKPQTARYAESGGDTVWVAGNEGSVAVWKLDPSRRTRLRPDNGKGKARETGDGDTTADSPEEVRLFHLPSSNSARACDLIDLTRSCGCHRTHTGRLPARQVRRRAQQATDREACSPVHRWQGCRPVW